jgi:hypothetical protein
MEGVLLNSIRAALRCAALQLTATPQVYAEHSKTIDPVLRCCRLAPVRVVVLLNSIRASACTE